VTAREEQRRRLRVLPTTLTPSQLAAKSTDRLERLPRGVSRPRTRGDCIDGPRPCPWVSCRHHLYLDVVDGGAIRLNFPNVDPGEMAESCSLDVADREAAPVDAVAVLVNTTEQGVLDTQRKAFARLRRSRADLRPIVGSFVHAPGIEEQWLASMDDESLFGDAGDTLKPAEVACRKCGAAVHVTPGPGRPRQLCDACKRAVRKAAQIRRRTRLSPAKEAA
jgi:hypothetical protein